MEDERREKEAEFRGRILTTLEGLAPLPDMVHGIDRSLGALQSDVTNLAGRMGALEESKKLAWWTPLIYVVVGASIGFGVSTFNKLVDRAPMPVEAVSHGTQ